MNIKTAKWLRIAGGILLIVIGIIFAIAPVIPGWILIIPGIVLLSPEIPFLNTLLEKIYEKYPASRKYLNKFRNTDAKNLAPNKTQVRS